MVGTLMTKERAHCDCIKMPGAIRGFGAWCKDHRRLLEDYEFQKAKADEVVRRFGELEVVFNEACNEVKMCHDKPCFCKYCRDASPDEPWPVTPLERAFAEEPQATIVNDALLRLGQTNESVWVQLREDLAIFGTSFSRRKADGTVERIDPRDVKIEMPPEKSSTEPM